VRKIVGPVEVTMHRDYEDEAFDVDRGTPSISKFYPPSIRFTVKVQLNDGTYYERDLTELMHETFERENYCSNESYWASRVWQAPDPPINRMWNYTGPWYPGSQKPVEPKKDEDKKAPNPYQPSEKVEEKKEEAPPKRRNLTSWPPTPE
jgi:hypothetical protein